MAASRTDTGCGSRKQCNTSHKQQSGDGSGWQYCRHEDTVRHQTLTGHLHGQCQHKTPEIPNRTCGARQTCGMEKKKNLGRCGRRRSATKSHCENIPARGPGGTNMSSFRHPGMCRQSGREKISYNMACPKYHVKGTVRCRDRFFY